MKKTPTFFLLALCPLIPAASNFAYGIILGIALLWYFGSGIVFREIIRLIDPGEAGMFIELVSIAASATIFNILLGAMLPVITTSLSLYLYISAFSYALMISIDGFFEESRQSLPIIACIPFIIIFSALRELIGSGTLSLLGRDGLIIHYVLPGFSHWGLGFWATSGGSLMLLGIITWAVKYTHRKIRSLGRYF